MIKNICIIIILIFAEVSISHACDKDIWSLPNNYPDLIKSAREGDHAAQEKISKIIYKGIIRYPNQKKINDRHQFDWLLKVHQSDSFEQKVARFFYTEGTSEDASVIFDDIKKKADGDDPYAQRAMGSCYFYTDLTNVSSETGVKWYILAAKQGHARAQMSLALRYLQGHHVGKNVSEGMDWLKMASDLGLPEAQHALSMYYLSGENIQKNLQKSFDLLLSSAKGGDTQSQLGLAIYHLGYMEGITFSIEKNEQEGIHYLTQASDFGDLEAMYMLGSFLFFGKHVTQDENKGTDLLKKAASLGSQTAKNALNKLDIS